MKAHNHSVDPCQPDKPVEVKQSPELDAASVVLVQLLHGGVGEQRGSDQEESVHAWEGIGYGGKQGVAKVGVTQEICER